MEVTLSPLFFSSTPMLLAVTPFPNPLTTPPVTSTYFITLCASVAAAACLPEQSEVAVAATRTSKNDTARIDLLLDPGYTA
jgi:hypothetical protein